MLEFFLEILRYIIFLSGITASISFFKLAQILYKCKPCDYQTAQEEDNVSYILGMVK